MVNLYNDICASFLCSLQSTFAIRDALHKWKTHIKKFNNLDQPQPDALQIIIFCITIEESRINTNFWGLIVDEVLIFIIKVLNTILNRIFDEFLLLKHD